MVPVSAKQRTGLEDLMEAILLTAEAADIHANPKGKVIGTVVEAQVDRAKGVMATLLVQNGTLQTGDTIVAGNCLRQAARHVRFPRPQNPQRRPFHPGAR